MITRKTLLAFVPVLLLTLWACAVNPVTGKRELNLMSEGQEVQLGMQSDQAIVGEYGLMQDAELARYVEGIGERMVPVSHRPDLDFHFRLLDDPVVNAFALPGGYVYITRGILAYLNSEAALAGVIGHEIGHVTARHGAQRYTQQALLGIGLGVGSILSDTFAQFAGVAGTAGQLLLLKYGRDDERQSDDLGVQYATAIGYDTHDMAEFFRTLDRLSPADGRIPAWMSTHPDPGERWNTVHELTARRQGEDKTFDLGRDRYLRRIDGIVFDADPREGYFENDVFHHAQLAFRFPVPAGWQTRNGKTQVVMVEPNQAAAVVFMSGGPGTPGENAQAFVSQDGVSLLERTSVSVGDGGQRTLARITDGQGNSQVVLSTWFTFGGGSWVFHGLTTDPAYRAQRSNLVLSADGFAREADPAVLGIQPYRLKVVEAPRAGQFAEIATAWPIPAGAAISSIADLALLNGLTPETPVSKGQLLKVVVR